jgi:cyclopropane fatty-acyl-phospholipid synthase-like methyltransferase
MNTGKRDFDKDAATWDEKPDRVKLAQDIARAIIKHIDLTPQMDVMDFGCGTGMLTIQIQPLVHSITGVDNAPGMLSVFKAKIAQMKLERVYTLLVDNDRGNGLRGNYDLVMSSMTLHHIQKIEPLFDQFFNVINPGGYLGIADLDLDGGEFHEDDTGVFHSGFDRAALGQVFTRAGFENVRETTAAEVEKPARNGQVRKFSVFLVTGQKRH